MAEQPGYRIRIRIRYFAAAKAAAQVDTEELVLDGPSTVQDVLSAISDLHGPRMAEVLRRCSYLLGEIAVHGCGSAVTDGDVLDVLPPFAGG